MAKPVVCLFNGKIANVGNVVLGYKAPPSEFLFVKIAKYSNSNQTIFNEVSSPAWEEAKTSSNSNMSDSSDLVIGSDASRYTMFRYPVETTSITFPRIITGSMIVYYYIASSMSTIGGYFASVYKGGTGGSESSITLNVPEH